MGLLAPLYALAALAVAAPIIFHLIHRQPRGQREFSSLMFLQASPPRLTRRSRLDNLLLLLLRGLALALIAFAFARPFLRSVELAEAEHVSREIVVLVDTSGSMQREDVWISALATAKKYVQGLGKTDQVSLASFDTRLNIQVPLPDINSSDGSPQAAQAATLAELDKLKPSYRSTRLAQCLIEAVELLQGRIGNQATTSDDRIREIVLFSDLHENSGIEALQGFAWPENIRLDIRRVSSDSPGNAHANILQTNAMPDPSEPEIDHGDMLRVRFENNKSSTQMEFDLRWVAIDGTPSPNVAHIQVPAGQVRVVPIPLGTNGQQRLELIGDKSIHDNVIDVPRTAPRVEHISFVGQTRDKPEEDLFFFLSQIPLSTPVRNVTVERASATQLSTAATDESLAGLVVEWPIDDKLEQAITECMSAGKPVIVVLSRPALDESPDQQLALGRLAKLLGLSEPPALQEAVVAGHAMWADIDFRHPLFQPLAEAKFNDFGKVRFWAHRDLRLPDNLREVAPDVRIIARFDDHSPAILHRRAGRGDLWVLTAGWQSTGSQLALSTKFVPLMFGMLDPQGRSMQLDAVYEVGENIAVTEGTLTSLSNFDETPVADLPSTGMSLEKPGLYWLTEDGKRRQIAITLPASESQLDPIDLDRFEQYGVVTGKSDSAHERREAARLSQVQELEGRQKLWRWLLVGALAVLLLETIVAARNSSFSA